MRAYMRVYVCVHEHVYVSITPFSNSFSLTNNGPISNH